MNRLFSKRRWLQFRLRSLLLLILLVAIGFGGWQYWRQTRHMWRLQWSITECLPRDSEEAKLLKGLAWDRKSWKSGLIDALGGRIPEGTAYARILWFRDRPKLKWSGEFVAEDGSLHRLYLFGQGYFDDPWWPLTCLVTDAEGRLVMWQRVPERNFWFSSAYIDPGTPPVLQIRSRNFSTTSIRCRYAITKGELNLIDEVEYDRDDLSGTEDSLGATE